MSSRSATWSIAGGLIQPTRSLTACSVGRSRWRRPRSAAPPTASWSRPVGAGPRTDSIAVLLVGGRCDAAGLQVHQTGECCSLSIRTAAALYSAVPDFGSVASMVSRLTSTSSGEVERHEHQILAATSHRGEPAGGHRTARRGRPDPFALVDAEVARVGGRDVDRLAETTRAAEPARLHARVERVEPPAGREAQGELRAHRLDRRIVSDHAERRGPTAIERDRRPTGGRAGSWAPRCPRRSTATGCR